MHRKHRYTAIDDRNAEISLKNGNVASAAQINASPFTRLPRNFILVQKLGHFIKIFSAGVRRVALAPMPHKFDDRDTAPCIGAVKRIKHSRIRRIVGRSDV